MFTASTPDLDLLEEYIDSDPRGRVRAGDLAVVPAMVPHGIANTGTEPLKVVGFFCESEIISTFAEPLQPIGLATLKQGEPVPA